MNDDRAAVSGGATKIGSLVGLESWKWVVVVFSYYVLLHLAPIEFLRSSFNGRVWSFLVIQMIVTVYLGWRSRESILLDVLLAGVSYALVFDRLHPTPPVIQSLMGFGIRFLSYIVIASFGSIGAIMGRLLYLRFARPAIESAPS